jgi:hypothetical protein
VKKLKCLRWDFGWIDIFIIFTSILLGTFNLLNQIDLGKDIIARCYLTLPFFIIPFIVVFAGKKIAISFIFIIIGVGIILDPSNISDFSGSIFFIFAFHIINKKKYVIPIGIITAAALAIRATKISMTIYESFMILLAYVVVYALYYFIIYKKTEKPVSVRFSQLNKEENKILEHMASGLSQKEAGGELGYDKFHTNYIVKEIRKKTGYNSLYEILYRSGLNNNSTNRHNK